MLPDEDESVRIAIRALGDMRNSAPAAVPSSASPSTSFQPTPALSISSGTSSPSLSSPSLLGDDPPRTDDADFVSRVSSIPLVNSALRAYEQGKASSRVVKYGAEMMESSVKTISRPVIDRLPVNQLDEFARRQLDRIESYTRRTPSQDRDRGRERGRSRTTTDYEQSRVTDEDNWSTRDVSMTRRAQDEKAWDEPSSRASTPRSQPLSSPYAHRSSHLEGSSSQQQTQYSSSATPENQEVARRSRWQAMLFEAGGIGAAVSEESMRRLRYCLQWLQYATTHIDTQILVLRNFIASLQPLSSSSSSHAVSSYHLRTLHAAKRDVVETLRQVVDVVSRYAGSALPEPARARVRSFILHLPRRWAHATGTDGAGPSSASGSASGVDTRTGGGVDRGERRTNAGSAPYSYGPGEAGPSQRSRPSSRATSPSRSKGHPRQGSSRAAQDILSVNSAVPTTADTATQAAQRILTLATESLDMLRGVTAVCKESLDRADAWVERLRVVGLQRQQNPEAGENDGMLDFREPPLPPLSHLSPPFAFSPAGSSQYSPTAPCSPLSTTSSGHATPLFPPPHMRRNLSSGSGFASPSASFYSVDSPSSTAFDALTLSSPTVSTSGASSRYTTPRSVLMGLPADGDSGGSLLGAGSFRGEKRGAEEDDMDGPTVAAAAALAGMAGAAKRAKQNRGREDGMLYMHGRRSSGDGSVQMDVDG
ncbi:transcription factor Opi1-domain-containing protein [Sparassis latifolia]